MLRDGYYCYSEDWVLPELMRSNSELMIGRGASTLFSSPPHPHAQDPPLAALCCFFVCWLLSKVCCLSYSAFYSFDSARQYTTLKTLNDNPNKFLTTLITLMAPITLMTLIP
jgi:hypothetical protein